MDFISDLIEQKMATLRIPGVAFVMVKDGKILLSKGFGYANLAEKKPVDPQKTLFRIASVSKIFTILAALQLIEQGKINLEAPTHLYLNELQIKNKFSTPQLVMMGSC